MKVTVQKALFLQVLLHLDLDLDLDLDLILDLDLEFHKISLILDERG